MRVVRAPRADVPVLIVPRSEIFSKIWRIIGSISFGMRVFPWCVLWNVGYLIGNGREAARIIRRKRAAKDEATRQKGSLSKEAALKGIRGAANVEFRVEFTETHLE